MIRELIISEWVNVWKWVESGTRRGLLQKENLSGLLLANLTQFTDECSIYQGLSKKLFENGYNALMVMWYI